MTWLWFLCNLYGLWGLPEGDTCLLCEYYMNLSSLCQTKQNCIFIVRPIVYTLVTNIWFYDSSYDTNNWKAVQSNNHYKLGLWPKKIQDYDLYFAIM